MNQTICVVGLGYIGLPTACVLSGAGFTVYGVDKNPEVLSNLHCGSIGKEEPDLRNVAIRAIRDGRLSLHEKPTRADIFIISVPTPINEDKTADLSCVYSAASDLASSLCAGNLLIIESTCPVGTTENVSQYLQKLRPDLVFPYLGCERADISIAYCPERVLPGSILKELVENDRIIGGINEDSCRLAYDLFNSFTKGRCYVTDSRTAEMVKLSENAYRDVNIAFANELSMIADHLEVDVQDVIFLANRHPRVNILNPGPGVGGHCIAVDPWFLVESAPEHSRLIKVARTVNDEKPRHVVDSIVNICKMFIQIENRSPVLTFLGLAYKPDVADLRESPAIKIVQGVCSAISCQALVVEPNTQELPSQLSGLNGIRLSELDCAIESSDIVVGLVSHKEFKNMQIPKSKQKIYLDYQGFMPARPKINSSNYSMSTVCPCTLNVPFYQHVELCGYDNSIARAAFAKYDEIAK